ncbi:MAG: hypothetical protein ABL985_21410 [Casimicrobium sp.]
MEMFSYVFEQLNGLASVIGWIAIVYGILWVAGKISEDHRARIEAQQDQEAMLKFEAFLVEEHPEKYNRYRDIRREYGCQNKDAHWHKIAQEAGFPISEIIKRR